MHPLAVVMDFIVLFLAGFQVAYHDLTIREGFTAVVLLALISYLGKEFKS